MQRIPVRIFSARPGAGQAHQPGCFSWIATTRLHFRANVDLRAFTERFYWKICGGHLQPVLDTQIYLRKETGVRFELASLLVPDENDSDTELEEMTCCVVEHLEPDVPMPFTAFHPDWKMRDKSPTPAETLSRARRVALKNGVRYAYTGNVHDEAVSSTYCHQCGGRLIGRDWYVITEWHLTADGRCPHRHAVCSGVLESRHGDWGSRRAGKTREHA
ncbi:MAG: AmmeMemoRadiSam system radical SAM enzyme [Gammaproteobacteria bacterium]